MPSTEEEDSLSQLAVVSAMPQHYSLPPVSRSPSTSVRTFPCRDLHDQLCLSCNYSRDSMSRERHRRYLQCAQQASRAGLQRRATPRNAHVHRQGLPSRHGVLRFHRRPEVPHTRTGLPPECVRPLEVDGWLYVVPFRHCTAFSDYFDTPTAPIEKGSKLETLVVGIRTRKGLKVIWTPILALAY
jgi:hypothetical protein